MPSFSVGSNGFTVHGCPSTGTTSTCASKRSGFLAPLPLMRATRFPRPGADSTISPGMPAARKRFKTGSRRSVSPPWLVSTRTSSSRIARVSASSDGAAESSGGPAGGGAGAAGAGGGGGAGREEKGEEGQKGTAAHGRQSRPDLGPERARNRPPAQDRAANWP